MEGDEECDDGNPDDTDTCTSACKNAACGDGFILAGVEGCDDGPGNGDDQACTTMCKSAACGDGLVGPGEACDDGNMVDNDACRNTCKSNLKKTFGPAQCNAGQDCQAQCAPWNAFRASLTAGPYTKVTLRGSNDMVGKVCTGATAQTLCQALKNGVAVGPLACDGNNWNVGTCGVGIEITTTGSICNCNSPGWTSGRASTPETRTGAA